jgi:release factor glutamine methyltransferase
MGEAFTKQGLESPRLLAELLMAHVLGCERLKLYMDADRPASPLERQTLRELVSRALKHEPIQYLVGEARFFGLDFRVDKRVLIPRPATETIVEHVLQDYRARHGPGSASSSTRGEGLLIADICTGSGCVAIALAKNLPGARVVATDISADALAVAKENASRHRVEDRVDFLVGDLFAPLAEYPPTRSAGSVDYLVSNPPYIPDDEWPGAVDRNVRDHEPHGALRGGPDGLRFAQPMIEQSPRLLKEGGLLLVEIAAGRAAQALEIARGVAGLADARILKDFEGLDRVILARRAA